MGDVYLNNRDRETLTLALDELSLIEIDPIVKDEYKRIIDRLNASHERQMENRRNRYIKDKNVPV